MHLFPPEAFAAPYTTIPIGELVDALVAKQLGRFPQHPSKVRSKDPISGRVVRARKSTDKCVVRSKISCEQSILTDLRAGILVAHVHGEATGQFRRISRSFWSEQFSGLALSNTIFELERWPTFSPELDGSNVYVTGENAARWLKSHGITEEDAWFPDGLRSPRDMPSPRRDRYNWPAFENEAVSRLHDEGAFQGEWRQARLEEHMLSWCQENWGKEPSPRTVRSRVKTAVRRFMRERKIEIVSLGN